MSELSDLLNDQRQFIEQALRFNIGIAEQCTKTFSGSTSSSPALAHSNLVHLAQRSNLRLRLVNHAIDTGSLLLGDYAFEHDDPGVCSIEDSDFARGDKKPLNRMVQKDEFTDEPLCTPLLRHSEPVTKPKRIGFTSNKIVHNKSLLEKVEDMMGQNEILPDMQKVETLWDEKKKLCETSRTRFECMFPEVDDLRKAVLSTISKHIYNVESLYCTTGCWQAWARHDGFKNLALLVIVLNTIWIGVEADHNYAIPTKAPLVYQVLDNVFCTFFSFEILVRFLAFANKRNAFADGWFVFDAVLVAMMVWETWILVFLFTVLGLGNNDLEFAKSSASVANNSSGLRLLRLIRLTRVARATRLLTSFPELLILVTGMLAGIRSVIAVLCFLSLVIYVFAIVFTQLFRGMEFAVGSFDNVPQAMNTLLLQVLCGPDADFMRQIFEVSIFFYFLFLCFVLVAVLTAMNMLTGILVDVVSKVAGQAQDQDFAKTVETQIDRLAAHLDVEGSGTISKHEFEIIVNDPEAITVFNELGIDVVCLADFARFIYAQCEELRYSAFAQLVSEFRGSKVATVKDFSNMRRYVSMEMLALEHVLERFLLKLSKEWEKRA